MSTACASHKWSIRTIADARWPERTDSFTTEVYCTECGPTEQQIRTTTTEA